MRGGQGVGVKLAGKGRWQCVPECYGKTKRKEGEKPCRHVRLHDDDSPPPVSLCPRLCAPAPRPPRPRPPAPAAAPAPTPLPLYL